jgi:predicted ATP-grasp superfamily ATP-dependent carboligase
VSRGKWDVLLAGSEASLLSISASRAALEPHVRLGLPPRAAVLGSLDKVLLQREAVAAGLAPPASIVCRSRAEAVEAAAALGYPLILKPTRSFREEQGALKQRVAQVVSNADGLDASLSLLGMPLTLQRFVRDARVVSCAAVRTSDGLAGFTLARYTRTWPPLAGSASLAKTIAPPDGLRELVNDLVDRIGWTGIFELELLELGDGAFGAIDLNPRVFGWLALALAAGANLPAIWCDHVLGRRSVAARSGRPGHRYRWEEGELKYVVWHVRRGKLRGLSPLRPYRRVVHAYFQLRDPAPLVAQALLLTMKGMRKPKKAPLLSEATRFR